jgi:hypothetical protein
VSAEGVGAERRCDVPRRIGQHADNLPNLKPTGLTADRSLGIA